MIGYGPSAWRSEMMPCPPTWVFAECITRVQGVVAAVAASSYATS